MNKIEYLLICLMEEAAEVQQIAAKSLRFGLGNHHPNYPETTNLQELARELGDIEVIKNLLVSEGIELFAPRLKERTEKFIKVAKYMDMSRACGILRETEEQEAPND